MNINYYISLNYIISHACCNIFPNCQVISCSSMSMSYVIVITSPCMVRVYKPFSFWFTGQLVVMSSMLCALCELNDNIIFLKKELRTLQLATRINSKTATIPKLCRLRYNLKSMKRRCRRISCTPGIECPPGQPVLGHFVPLQEKWSPNYLHTTCSP